MDIQQYHSKENIDYNTNIHLEPLQTKEEQIMPSTFTASQLIKRSSPRLHGTQQQQQQQQQHNNNNNNNDNNNNDNDTNYIVEKKNGKEESKKVLRTSPRKSRKNDDNQQQNESVNEKDFDKEILGDSDVLSVHEIVTSSDLDELIDEDLLRKHNSTLGNEINNINKDDEEEEIVIRESKRIKSMRDSSLEPEEENVNNDYCETCGQPGKFVCCESCPRSFHFNCAEPPVDSEQLEFMAEWYCKACRGEKASKKHGKVGGIFSELISNMEKMNPRLFRLPKDIQRCFNGVYASSDGDYLDERDQKTTRNRIEDMFKLCNNDSNPILCHVCGKSAVHGQPIIRCDYCPLNWHMDCLDPPLTSAPAGNRKWKCPAHVDHLIERRRVLRGDLPDVLLDQTDSLNDGDIEVLLNKNFPSDRRRQRQRKVRTVNYRLPEDTIKLAFVEKAQRQKSTQEEANDWLVALTRFHGQVFAELTKDSTKDLDCGVYSDCTDLDMLRRVAVGADNPQMDTNDPLFQQFLAWKRMMQIQQQQQQQ